MTTARELRPIERRVLDMRREGLDFEEIGSRLRHSPGHIRRILQLMKLRNGKPRRHDDPRPLERRVVFLRASGESYSKIAERFKRSPHFIRQVEGLAYVKNSRSIHTFRHGESLLERTSAEARRRSRLRAGKQEG